MTTKKRNTKNPSPPQLALIQLPCRSTPRDAALIRKGAELDRRSVTSFIISAAAEAAKVKMAAHGITEADVLAELDAPSIGKRA